MSSTEKRSPSEIAHWSLKKKAVFSLLPLICLVLTAEVLLRVAAFQARSEHPLAVMELVEDLQHRIAVAAAKWKVGGQNIPEGAFEALFSAEGTELLREFRKRYEGYFQQLVEAVEKDGVRLILLYYPTRYPGDSLHVLEMNRRFFHELCEKYRVDFLDVSPECLRYPQDVVTLLPCDSHPSRFGNQIVADSIERFIGRYDRHRSRLSFAERPGLLGDLPPNVRKISKMKSQLPFRLVTNSQGLRMSHDLEFPKKKQRILLLGDSYTFGEHLHNQDTLAEILNRKIPQKEFVNGGICGYTISDEISLYVERARYMEPDLTILQVLDNDLYGLFAFKLNQFDRKKRVHAPSPLEEQFLERLRAKGKQTFANHRMINTEPRLKVLPLKGPWGKTPQKNDGV